MLLEFEISNLLLLTRAEVTVLCRLKKVIQKSYINFLLLLEIYLLVCFRVICNESKKIHFTYTS